jgi:hypothetical protein
MNKLINRITLNVPKELQLHNHSYAGYGGPWIEDYFYSHWCCNEEELLKDSRINRIYIPIFWTGYYSKYGHFKRFKKIQKFIDKSIEPDKKYFTIVQNSDGVKEKLPKNVLIFGGGGKGDISIPLLKGDIKYTIKQKDIKCSFMGNLSGPSNKTSVRSKMFDILKNKKGFYFSNGDIKEFRDITSRSVFTLCPRGYGRTSFRLYEAMALGSIPIYIWDDIEWLPYKDKLRWEESIISINIRDIKNLPEIINAHTPEMIKQKQEKIKALYNQYFTMEETCKQIIEILRTDEEKYKYLKCREMYKFTFLEKIKIFKFNISQIIDKKAGDVGIFLRKIFPRLYLKIKKIK